MNDLLDNELAVGDLVLFPAGSPRYSGLHLNLGIVVKITAARVGIVYTKLVTTKRRVFSRSSKMGKKLFLTRDPAILALPVVDELRSKLSEK